MQSTEASLLTCFTCHLSTSSCVNDCCADFGICRCVDGNSAHNSSCAFQDVSSNALRARALWLIGACGSDLPQPQWEEALQLVAQHMQASDLVVSLTAVAALMPLLTIILEEEQVS